jgi:transposase-like protein
MYALGLTAGRTRERLKDVYAVDVPPELTSRVTEEEKELAAVRRGRALEPFYPALFLDVLGRTSGVGARRSRNRRMAPAVRLDGQKELGETEFRAGCGLSEMRGVGLYSPRSGRAS